MTTYADVGVWSERPGYTGLVPDADLPLGYYSVGDVAALLGVAPATVRSWGRRYGLVPAVRTQGGHRRFAPEEVGLLRRMQELVVAGLAPAQAARQVLAHDTALSSAAGCVQPPQGFTTPARRSVLGAQVGSTAARSLARAAARLDVEAATGEISDLLVRRGAQTTWRDVVEPVLLANARRGEGDRARVEQVLTDAVITAAKGYCAFLSPPARGRPILLACAPDEPGTVPLLVLRAALAEHRVGSVVVGARVSVAMLADAARRTGAGRVVVWRQRPVPSATTSVALRPDAGSGRPEVDLLPQHLPAPLVVAGPGWAGVRIPHTARRAADLRTAVRVLHG